LGFSQQQQMKWDVIYEKALRDDGSLLFPERLTQNFLDEAKRTMGSYIFANQYQNEIIPTDQQTFKPYWNRYWVQVPEIVHTVAFIDPAISEAKHADYTALAIVAGDINQNWYLLHASRSRINPSQIIDLMFKVYERYNPLVIGIEDVAFQRSLVHFATEEMKRRNMRIPVQGVKRANDKSKEMRILSLVPRFEWGTLLLTQGMQDLELELAQFPRGAHDDILDALSSIAEIMTYPKENRNNEKPFPASPNYESWYIKQLHRRSSRGQQ
jgi:predicted phage terminase large subunit-like protein